MKLIIEPTPGLHDIKFNDVTVPARLWVGVTDKGTPIEAYVICIVPPSDVDAKDQIPDFMNPNRKLYKIGEFEFKDERET